MRHKIPATDNATRLDLPVPGLAGGLTTGSSTKGVSGVSMKLPFLSRCLEPPELSPVPPEPPESPGPLTSRHCATSVTFPAISNRSTAPAMLSLWLAYRICVLSEDGWWSPMPSPVESAQSLHHSAGVWETVSGESTLLSSATHWAYKSRSIHC